MARETYVEKALGDSLSNKVSSAKVLIVGAGGIGCELLKNIVLLGFADVHIVDLDTIDLSNLNRQFLFGQEHIKKSKAIIAKQTASKFNPNVNIVAYHDNIKDTKFNIDWFRQFDIVFNALDNLDARRHVNKMCLVANVPLVESGTAGFNGQVQVIKGGVTECYDCNPKPTTKSFPVCTIRSTPSQPIHCIVWAKSYLFAQLFEASDELQVTHDDPSNDESLEERSNRQKEATELRQLKESVQSPDFDKIMFDKIFGLDINRLLSMDSMWKTRKAPIPLDFDVVHSRSHHVADSVVAQEQKPWTLEESFVVLRHSLKRLQKRVSAGASLEFDKDDVDTLDFVAAAANIRSHIFHIPTKSKFDIKKIAGSIIPAIATTNAIVAGLCVLQSLKLLDSKLDDAKTVWISRQPERFFSSEKIHVPNPDCVVCGVARGVVKGNLSTVTLGDLVQRLHNLGYSEFSIVSSSLLYDPDFDDNESKTLASLNLKSGGFITIIDEDEEPRVNLDLLLEDAEVFSLEVGKISRKPKEAEREEESTANGLKRRIDWEEDDEKAKKQKLEDNVVDENGVIVIDVGDDDFIELD